MRKAQGTRARLFTSRYSPSRNTPDASWRRRRDTRPSSPPHRGYWHITADGTALVGLFLLAMGSLRWPVAQPERRQCVPGNWDLHTRSSNTSAEHAPRETRETMQLTDASDGRDRLNACNYDWPRKGPIAIARSAARRGDDRMARARCVRNNMNTLNLIACTDN